MVGYVFTWLEQLRLVRNPTRWLIWRVKADTKPLLTVHVSYVIISEKTSSEEPHT